MAGAVSSVNYDLLVLGGGPGGAAVSRRSAGYGAKVCVVERGACRGDKGARCGAGIGGTCVNLGCIPKKIMFMAAQAREAMVGSTAVTKNLGMDVPESAGRVDWATLKRHRDAHVQKLQQGFSEHFSKEGVDTVIGYASFLDPHTVKVTSEGGAERTISAPKVVIACGGEPALPDIPGKELAITSDGFFDLEEQPRKVAVVGAGYVAVELACFLNGLGSEVDVFCRGRTVLRHGFDPFVVEALMDHMKAHGPKVLPESTVARLERGSDGKITLVTKQMDGAEVAHAGYDAVIMAVGRRPVTDGLCLDKAEVKVDKRGLIEVDPFENTSAGNIFAIGDATNSGYEHTPVAVAAGRRLADRLFGNEARARIEYDVIPRVVFSHPPIGCIGVTEPDARDRFGDDLVKVKQVRFCSLWYALNEPEHQVHSSLKLVLKGPEELVIGLHCCGPFSDEMLQGFAIAVRMGATRADFEATIGIHPTIAEEFVTFAGWGQTQAPDGCMVPQLSPYLAGSYGLRHSPKVQNPTEAVQAAQEECHSTFEGTAAVLYT